MVFVVTTGEYMRALVKYTVRGKRYSSHCANVYLHAVLTFAGFHALKPPVVNVFVACTSAVLKPSTARSATTVSAGFLEFAAFGARHRVSDR